MTTYIDLSSLAQTPELARAKAEVLELAGTLILPEHRASVLQHAKAGDTVYTGSHGLNFWRKLNPRVHLIDITDLGRQDATAKRITSWLTWALIQFGMTPTEARRLEDSPPKTSRHGRYLTFKAAEQLANAWRMGEFPIPPALETIGSEHALAPREQPYKWKLIETAEDVVVAEILLRESGTICNLHAARK